MKRRRFFQTIAASAPGAVLLRAQQGPRGPAADEPKLETVTPSEAGEPVLRFFNPDQFAALRRLSGILMPSRAGTPGAIACGVPEFLDFLVGESPGTRQHIYTEGLNTLNAEARKRHQKPFSDLSDPEATDLLLPLRRPWTYELPADPLAHFLLTAKADVQTATANSREYATAGTNGGGRRQSGQGLYWSPLD